MHLSHTPAALSISFDDPTLVSAASLVPVMCLADTAGLSALAQHRMSIAGDKGANAGAKITTLVAGMVAGADSLPGPTRRRPWASSSGPSPSDTCAS